MSRKKDKELCLLLVGKTGNGKSTLGNNILGKSSFTVKVGMASKTKSESIGTDKKKHWKVVETKDLLNQMKSDKEQKQEVKMWKTHQPDIVLLVVKAEARYTREEFELYSKVKEQWGSDLTDRLAVVFTFGEACTKDMEHELEHASPELRTVLGDAKNRYCVFGRDGEMEEKSSQTLDDIVKDISHGGDGGHTAGGGGGGGGAQSITSMVTSDKESANTVIIAKDTRSQESKSLNF